MANLAMASHVCTSSLCRQRPNSGLFSSKRSALTGSQQGLQMSRGSAAVVMARKGIHPEYFDEAKVFCNGEEVLTTSGTKASYTVDIWSGNHPFFQGVSTNQLADEGRVNRFKRRYGGLESISTPAEGSSKAVKLEMPGKKDKGKGKKGGKK